jgi:hypothetical protein
MSLRYTCTHMVSEDNLVEVSEDNGIAVRVLCIHTHTHTHTHTSALSISLSLSRARTLKHIFPPSSTFSFFPTLALSANVALSVLSPPQLSGQVHPPSMRG